MIITNYLHMRKLTSNEEELFSTLNVSFTKMVKNFPQNVHWGNFQESLTLLLTCPIKCIHSYTHCHVLLQEKLKVNFTEFLKAELLQENDT